MILGSMKPLLLLPPLFLVILFKRDDTRNLIILVYVLDIVLFHLFGALLISFFFDNWIIRKIIRGSMQFVCFFNEIYWILVLIFVLIDHDAVFLLPFSSSLFSPYVLAFLKFEWF